MPHIEGGTAKLSGQIIRVGGKERAALAISIVGGFTQRVTREERQRPAKSIIETNEQLVLIKPAARLVLVDLSDVAKGTRSAGSGNGCIDIAGANHVLNPDQEQPGKQCEPFRQLPLYLRPAKVNHGGLEVIGNPPGYLTPTASRLLSGIA